MQSALFMSVHMSADRKGLGYAISNKLTPFISMQNHYSLIYREEEREMLPTLKVRHPYRISQHLINCLSSTLVSAPFLGPLLPVVFSPVRRPKARPVAKWTGKSTRTSLLCISPNF